jgi:hypothetical protein
MTEGWKNGRRTPNRHKHRVLARGNELRGRLLKVRQGLLQPIEAGVVEKADGFCR